jgi:sporulation protein YlmC with PRC-barrel domain
MSYTDRDPLGIYRNLGDDSESGSNTGPGPSLMGADTLIGDDVYNHKDEDLGDIKEIMLDMRTGQIAYAVLSFGGIMGMGEKLFAVPWQSLRLDTANKRFVLDVEKDRLQNAPGFDKDHWPDMSDQNWTSQINTFYGAGSATGTAAAAPGSARGGSTGTRTGGGTSAGSTNR